MEIPPFCGEDPDSWIRKAEKYFSFYQLNEREKLEAATVSFKGQAKMWFDWEEQNGTVRSWYNLKKLILGQFRPWDEEKCVSFGWPPSKRGRWPTTAGNLSPN